MTKYTFFFLLILAHVVGDFTLQSSKIVKSKNMYGRGYVYHILLVLLSYVVFTFFYFGLKWFVAIVIIVGAHAIIDYCKIKAGRSIITNVTGDSIALLSDQSLHLLFMLLAFYLLGPWSPHSMYIRIINRFMSHIQIMNALPNKLIFLSACYLFITRGGTVFVKTLNGGYRNEKAPAENRILIRGVTVGEVERIAIFTLFVFQMYVWVVAVMLVKIVAQYYLKKSEEKNFRSSLYSFALALLVGAVYNTIFIW